MTQEQRNTIGRAIGNFHLIDDQEYRFIMRMAQKGREHELSEGQQRKLAAISKKVEKP